MDAWQAIVLGLVEGLTEYLPISSTGHLILAERALGIGNDESSRAFAICIQAGAIAAVLGLYFPRVKAMAAGFVRRDAAGRRLLANLAVAFLPAAVVGVSAEKWIDAHLFGLWPVVAAWLAGGAAILAWDRGRPSGSCELESMSPRVALLIGFGQCLALWPGVSRSLATIAGGLVLGLSMSAAVEFSLLLGLATLLAATAHTGLHHGGAMLGDYGLPSLALGFGVAFASAWLAVKWMVGWLRGHGLRAFGYYRVVLALLVAAALALGRLSPA